MEALLSMVEHVSIYKAITTVYEGGLSHKSVVVRTHVAMLVDHVITALGPEKFYGSSKDTQVQFILHPYLGLWSMRISFYAQNVTSNFLKRQIRT